MYNVHPHNESSIGTPMRENVSSEFINNTTLKNHRGLSRFKGVMMWIRARHRKLSSFHFVGT